MSVSDILLIVTATCTALIAGLLYAYSCSVNIGLGRLNDQGYVSAMQSINRAIQNPLFFASFMGSLLLLPLCTVLQYRLGAGSYAWLLSATLVYTIGVFGVTLLGNVPLNNALDSFNLQSSSPQELANMRARFEGPWNRLHTIRTLAAVVALILVIIACMSRQHTGAVK